MRKITLLAAVLALIAVSCKAEINVGLDVNADGSGSVVAEFGFDEEFQELAFSGSDPSSEVFADNDLADVPGATFDEYTEGDLTFYRVKVPFQDISDIEEQAGGDNPFEGLSITATGDEVRVSASFGSADSTFLDPEDLQGAEQFGAEMFEEIFDFNVRITMPGKVVSSNATRVLDGGTLEWDIPFTGEELTIEAVSDPTASPDGDGFPVWIIGIIVLVVLAGAVFLVMRLRNKPGEEPPTTAAAGSGTTVASAAPEEAAPEGAAAEEAAPPGDEATPPPQPEA